MTKPLTRVAIGCLALAACAHAGGAGALTVTVGEANTAGMMTTIPVTLTNAGHKPHGKAAVTCTFFDAEGRPLTVSRTFLPPIAAGSSASETVMLHKDLGAVARHACAVD